VDEAETRVPRLSFLRLFLLFASFGVRAFGGPMPQIAMLKQQLVVEGRWITVAKFNRVLAVYQALPGPEAAEMCCYFGLLARGRLGALVAGLGFILPGFVLVLLASFLYAQYGLTSPYVLASFRAMQPTVCAMILKALHKLADHAFLDHRTKEFTPRLGALGLLATLLSVLRVNFFITLVLAGIINALAVRPGRAPKIAIALLLAVALAVYVTVVVLVGMPTSLSLGAGVIGNNSLGGLFLLGLLAGLLTFGGAYTAIPFVQQDAVVVGGWLTQQQFLDGLGITGMLPTPLVMFVTFVGYLGGGVAGAVLMTVGMFIPAFSFTIFFHTLFERLVEADKLAPVLDGVTAATLGMVLVSAMELIRATLTDPLSVAVFTMALFILVHINHKYTGPILMAFAAMVGQSLFRPAGT
jgi:chromate transporter